MLFPMLAIAATVKDHISSNGAPVIAGYWEESSGKIWKSEQRGNLFTWTQHGTNKVAKGIIVAPLPDAEASDWQVFITFESTLTRTNMQLNFNSDFTSLLSKNDVFKRIAKPAIIKDVLPIHPEAIALADIGLPNLYKTEFKDNAGHVWKVCAQTCSGVLVFKSQTEKRFFRAYVARCIHTNEYVIYMNFSEKDLRRSETYDIRKWPMPNKDSFSSTNQVIVFK